MIAATRRWVRRNRTNFIVGAGVIGAGYLAGQYVLGRIREATQRMTEDRASKENLRRRFQQNQEDCTYTVLALLPTIRDEIIGALPVEQITEQLQQERLDRQKRLAASEAASSDYPSAPPSIVDDASTASFIHASQLVEDRPKRSKAQLWQDMKINSIARALSLLYTTALLTLLTRIQLNLLGRRTYLSSVVSMASPPPAAQSSVISLEDHDGSFDTVYGNDFETNRMYLTFSWWLLHRGAKRILDNVLVAVKDVFGQVNIREDMSIERLSELIIEVRRRIEGATEEERRRKSWLEFLLPPREEELFVINQAGLSDGSESASPEPARNPLESGSVSNSLRRLLDETADLIDSPTFALVLSHLLDAGFSHLVDVRIASEAFKAAVPLDGARITELPDMKCKLAHILPVFCRQAHAIVVGSGELDAIAGVASSGPVPNEYLALMDGVHDLEAFAAVIYSSNFEYEVVDSPRPETSSLLPSVVSLRDSQSFTLDDTIAQTRNFVGRKLDQTREAVEPTVKQIQQSVERGVDSARNATQPRIEQVQESLQRVFGQVQDAVAPKVEQAQDAVAHNVEQVKEVVKPKLEQAQESVVRNAEQAKETAQQTSAQVRDTVSSGLEQAQDSAARSAGQAKETLQQGAEQTKETVQQGVQQTKETVQQGVQQTKETVQPKLEQARESAVRTAEQTKQTVQPKLAQAQESAVRTAEQAKQTVQPKLAQAQESATRSAEQVKQSVQPKLEQAQKSVAQGARQTQDIVKPKVEQAQAATTQTVQQVTRPVSESVKQPSAPRGARPTSAAVGSNTLEQSGPDLTKSVFPINTSQTQSLNQSSSDLAESGVVVDRTPTSLSQSAVVVDRPTASQSTVDVSRSTAPPPDFESAWTKAVAPEGGAKSSSRRQAK